MAVSDAALYSPLASNGKLLKVNVFEDVSAVQVIPVLYKSPK